MVIAGSDESLESCLAVVVGWNGFLSTGIGERDGDLVVPDGGSFACFGEHHGIASEPVADGFGSVVAVSFLEHQPGARQRVAIEQDHAADGSQFGEFAGGIGGGQVKADRIGAFLDDGCEEGFFVVGGWQWFIGRVFGVGSEESDGDGLFADRSPFESAIESQFVVSIFVGASRAGLGELVVKVDLCSGKRFAVERDPADDVSECSAAGSLESSWFVCVAAIEQCDAEDQGQQERQRQVGRCLGEASKHRRGSPVVATHRV